MDEFTFIRDRFERPGAGRADTLIGIGDDAAVVALADGEQIVRVCRLASTPEEVGADGLARDSFGAALVALACAGAEPRWATLALTLPSIAAPWLEAFAAVVSSICSASDVELIGGDTTRGPLCACVFAMGVRAERHTAPPRPASSKVTWLEPGPTADSADAIARLTRAALDLSRAGCRVQPRHEPAVAGTPGRLALAVEPVSQRANPVSAIARAHGLLAISGA